MYSSLKLPVCVDDLKNNLLYKYTRIVPFLIYTKILYKDIHSSLELFINGVTCVLSGTICK